MKKFISRNEEETKKIAEEIAGNLKAGDIIALYGGLGAGKTTLVRGVANALGCISRVTSPTFTLVNEYTGKYQIFHFDMYRLEDKGMSDREWIDEYLFGDGICLIEWADNIENLLPHGCIRIEIKTADSENNDYREITIC